MQWLIDLIIEAIGVPPCYIDRGDPAAFDFTKASFLIDGTWRELDLSAIVPAGATAVTFTINYASNVVSRAIRFRRHGNVNDRNVSLGNTPVANVSYPYDGIVAVDTDRKIDYKIEAGLYGYINMAIKGWWL